MPRHYLFGPVPGGFAETRLARQRRGGVCLTFGTEPGAEITIAPNDTWGAVCDRLPAGWQPDFLALWLPYTTVPACLWSAPLPRVALAPDWHLLWHYYRRRLPDCDLTVTDPEGASRLARQGIGPVLTAPLFGCPADALEDPGAGPRDIDVLFLGNLNPAMRRECLPWLAPLSPLAARWTVRLEPNGPDAAARRTLLRRARVVLTGVRDEGNRVALEAAAAGALVFYPSANREFADLLQDRRHAVCFTGDDLRSQLEHYLSHEEERAALAAAGRDRAAGCTFEALWEATSHQIETTLASLPLRPPPVDRNPAADLLTRSWQALASSRSADASLVEDLQAALRQDGPSAPLHKALGLALARRGPAAAEAVTEQFRLATQAQPSDVLAALNHAEALAATNHRSEAIDAARTALAVLDRLPGLGPALRHSGHFPPAFDVFRVEWERAAWENAGLAGEEDRAKSALLRWRLHALLASLTDDLGHRYEAYLARPDLPLTRSALGSALARCGRPVEAVHHLRGALAGDPFDAGTARALADALAATGDVAGRLDLAHQRRLLAVAAPRVLATEEWFAHAVPPQDELASVIVICHNGLAYTRLCIESVLRRTRRPYELILLDNASTDGTSAYLEEVRYRPGPARVEVVRSDDNRPLPAACNKALDHATGRYLVFLHNDTVLTDGWLDGLVGRARKGAVGLVGPISNYAAAPQKVDVAYDDDAGLLRFAEHRRRHCPAQTTLAERLSAFCLLLRRDVIERVGSFDERFETGFYADDDLCLRAREAGFQVGVAQDVFVHHFGSRTYRLLGLDVRARLLAGRQTFLAKWGPSRAGVDRPAEPLPQPPGDLAVTALAAAPTPRRRVSLTMIVRNEEANIGACLGSVADLVDEVIVVDTGSTDATREVAARCGARVFEFPWCDHFAAARNESLRHASGEWALWLDADDRLDEENRTKLKALFEGLGDEDVAYVMKVRSSVGPGGTGARVLDQVRLFRNHPYVRWRYRVHEQILPSIGQWGGQTRWTDVVIHHTGYQDPALRQRKLERNLHLLELEVAEQPDDAFTLFNLGRSYLDLGRTEEALPVLRRSLERSAPGLSIVRKLYALLAQGYRQAGQRKEALAACAEGLARYPDDAELLFHQAMLLREGEDVTAAKAALQRLLQSRPGEYFDMVDVGLRGYKARHQLASIHLAEGELAEAEALWRAALVEQPNFSPAWEGLGELFLRQRRWPELEEVAGALLAQTPQRPDGELLRARAMLGRQEYAAARRSLEETVGRWPQELRPRVLLTHALIRAGDDDTALEAALRSVLALDPQHAEARHNLDVLLRRRAGPQTQATRESSPVP